MADDRVRIGLLGAGAMGMTHAAAYAGIPGAAVVGVFSRDQARARAAAALCGAEPRSDLDALIADAAVDSIDVCLPSATHRACVIRALNEGKHVFCETPLAHRLDEAREMVDAAQRAGRLLQVGLLMRSVGDYGHIEAAATSGTYGRLLSLSTWRLASYLRPGALERKAHYGDPAFELLAFDFDFIQWAMGRPARLSASAAQGRPDSPGEISALLSFGDGRHATAVASGLMPPGFPFSVGFRALFERAVFQHRAVFEDNPPRSTLTLFEEKAAGRIIPIPSRNPYLVELQRFVDCISGRADPSLLDGERAIEALALAAATQRALAEARTIDLA